MISTMETVPTTPAPSSTSAYLAKVTTSESPAQIGGLSTNSPLVLKRNQFEHAPQLNNCHPVATQ